MCLIAYGRLVGDGARFGNPVPVTIALMLLTVPLYSAELAGAASAAELGSRYSQALARKSADAYSLLICWDRVLPEDRKSLESGFAGEAGNTATNFRFLTLDQMDQEIRKAGGMPPTRKPLSRGGVTFDFNLPVIGYLMYDSSSQDGKSQGNAAVPVGMKGASTSSPPALPFKIHHASASGLIRHPRRLSPQYLTATLVRRLLHQDGLDRSARSSSEWGQVSRSPAWGPARHGYCPNAGPRCPAPKLPPACANAWARPHLAGSNIVLRQPIPALFRLGSSR